EDRLDAVGGSAPPLVARRLADLADQVVFTGHRLRLFAGFGEPIGDVSLQGGLANGRCAADSNTPVTARDQCPYRRQSAHGCSHRMQGPPPGPLLALRPRAFARTIASRLQT